MKVRVIALCAAALFAFVSTSAEARHRTHYRHKAHTERVTSLTTFGTSCDNNGRCWSSGSAEPARYRGETRTASVAASYDDGRVVGHPSGCPRSQFCGCGASVRIFGHPVRDLYLAANWRKFPSASPAPGMAAWRYGHVFVIEQVNGDGTVVAYDANSGGHQTRVHTVSLRGYRVVNPHGGRYASSS